MSAVPATPSRAAFNGYLAHRWREWAITVAAFVLALLVGAVLMVVADPQVIGNFAYLFTAPASQAVRTVEALREKQAADA